MLCNIFIKLIWIWGPTKKKKNYSVHILYLGLLASLLVILIYFFVFQFLLKMYKRHAMGKMLNFKSYKSFGRCNSHKKMVNKSLNYLVIKDCNCINLINEISNVLIWSLNNCIYLTLIFFVSKEPNLYCYISIFCS